MACLKKIKVKHSELHYNSSKQILKDLICKYTLGQDTSLFHHLCIHIGLTKEEIDAALARSGTAGDEHAPLQPTSHGVSTAGPIQPYASVPQPQHGREGE